MIPLGYSIFTIPVLILQKEETMLSPVEIAAVIAATKGAVDIFDKLAGPIKRVILGQPKFDQTEAKDQRWRFRVETAGKDVVVKEGDYTRQTITGAELSKALGPQDLVLVQAYERKMQDYFELWTTVYACATNPSI